VKICITSTGKDLSSNVDPRFGRCQYFVITDTDSPEFEVVENPSINSFGGAGIQSAQVMADKGVQTVLTGNVGPNAFKTLDSAGIKIVTGIKGTIKDAISKFKNEATSPANSPSVSDHFGMKQR